MDLRTAALLATCLAMVSACVRAGRAPDRSISGTVPPPYFGQPLPGTTPVPFAPGVVNTEAVELNGVFTPDGRELFFTRIVDGVDTIHRSVVAGGSWSEPRPLKLFPTDAAAIAVDMAVSPDGEEL